MKSLASLFALTILLISSAPASLAQQRRPLSKASTSTRPKEIGSTAVVIDETLSVLRAKPSLFAEPIQRMRRGRRVVIQGVAEADGVRFYKVAAPPNNFGWVQSDAVFGSFRPNDEERLARLVQASDGFDQIEIEKLCSDLDLIETVGRLHEPRKPFFVRRSECSKYRVGLYPAEVARRRGDLVKPDAVGLGNALNDNPATAAHSLDGFGKQARLRP